MALNNGLLQITNLALPITSPFNEGTARYSVDGNRVTFESIELRAKDMMMQANGHLDFGTKQGASTASGLINGAGSVGAVVGGTLPGLVQKQWGWQGVFTVLAAAVQPD